jgi:hypothetical protein
MDIMQPVCLKHVLPDTLFTISLTDFSSFMMRKDFSVIDTQTYQEWNSLTAFYKDTGYTPETTIDAWMGEVVNPDLDT